MYVVHVRDYVYMIPVCYSGLKERRLDIDRKCPA